MQVFLACCAGKCADPTCIPHTPTHHLKVGRLIIDLTSKTFLNSESIPAHLLNIKLALPHIVEHLTSVYNLCVKRIVFRKLSKTAKVIPFPKQNADRSDPNNFRPFFVVVWLLIFVFLRPLERHVHNHLSILWRNTTFFYDLQSGFRSKHSCHTALTALCHMWLSAINRSETVGAVSLDFKNAFDLVDHMILQQ